MYRILIIALAVFLIGQLLMAGDVDKKVKKKVEKEFEKTEWKVIMPLYNQLGHGESYKEYYAVINVLKSDGDRYWTGGFKKDNNLERFWQKFVAAYKVEDKTLAIAITESITGERSPARDSAVKYRELFLMEIELGAVVKILDMKFKDDGVLVRILDEWTNNFFVLFEFDEELSKSFTERELFDQMWSQVFEKVD